MHVITCHRLCHIDPFEILVVDLMNPMVPLYVPYNLLDDPATLAAGAAAVVGTIGSVAALSASVPALAVPGAAPIGVVAPGAVGGGILPIGSSVVVSAGLALVPLGLTAVAIFPPSGSQQRPALSVIFSESPTVIRYILTFCTIIFNLNL